MEIIKKTPDKRKEYEKVVVEEDAPLEKKREQRAEQLEKYIWERDPEQGPGEFDKVVQWTKETGAAVVPASQSLFDLEAEEKRLREVNIQHELGKDLDPIVKRTPQQRLEAMVEKLKASDPIYVDAILQDIASEYWKAGMPVTVDDLRRVASHFLNRTERKK